MAEEYNEEYCDIINSDFRIEAINRIDSLWEKIKKEAIREYSIYLDFYIRYEDEKDNSVDIAFNIRKHIDYVEEIKNKRIELLNKRDKLIKQIRKNKLND